jgi:hypothetical protein
LRSVLCPVFGARAEGPQIVPVVDAVVVAIFPDDGQRVGTDSFYVSNASGWRVGQVLLEDLRARLGMHIFMAAPARCTGATCAQKAERVDADVAVIPGERKLAGFLVDRYVCRFLIHDGDISPQRHQEHKAIGMPTKRILTGPQPLMQDLRLVFRLKNDLNPVSLAR